MKRRIHLCLVILCAIFSLGIGTFSDKNIEKKSHLHRQKRVIDRTMRGRLPVWIEDAPYIVNIQQDGRNKCAGSILTAEVILSNARCFRVSNATYTIFSGSLHIGGRIRHTIINKLIYPHYEPTRLQDDLALLFIYPHIDFEHTHNRQIQLFNGTITPNSPAVLTGWSRNPNRSNRLVLPNELRSIIVPIISLNACRQFYREIRDISEKEICTLDRQGRKYGTAGDSGGPLVVPGGQIGVYSWSGSKSRRENPDIYMNLLYPLYRNWIISNAQIDQSFF